MADEQVRSERVPVRRPYTVIAAVVIVLAVVAGVLLYSTALPGLSVARSEPPGIEVDLATWLLRHSVPTADREKQNPLAADAANVAAGRELFRQ